MNGGGCPRLFQAEAVRDGRLDGAERASFERHAACCAACSRETRALEKLSHALRESEAEDADEMRVRRERIRLLAAFDDVLVVPDRHRHKRPLLWLAVVSVGIVVGMLVLKRFRLGLENVQASSTVIRASEATIWSKYVVGDREKLILEQGDLWVHVDHSFKQHKLVMTLPDGELEDNGTTFDVSAERDHTTRVAVREGRVLLRLHGRPSLTIGAGETWTPQDPVSPARTEPVPPDPVPPARQPASFVPNAPLLRSSASDSARSSDVSAEFRAAMDALGRGDNRDAARLFEIFLVKHSRDPRAEDAAYSRVIALERCGDSRRMKQAAEEYLLRYPEGFRRAEVERLSR
jgi:hypothetical protein